MAKSYGNTIIEEKNSSRLPQGSKNNTSLPPIIDEDNPIPDTYQGNITFTRTIYSKGEFNNKTNTSFNELNSTNLPIEIDQFFNFYNEIFFDIPREGENSHTTLMENSLDYIGSYNNPFQGIVDNLETQISELQQTINILEAENQNLLLGSTGDLETQINNQAAQAEYDAYLAEIGNDINNPILTYTKIVAKQSQGGYESNSNRRKKDLEQAYEKARASDKKYQNRSTSEWIADVKKSSSGKKQDDLILAIGRVKQDIKNKLSDLNPNS